MPELQAYTGERQETIVLPSTQDKPQDQQATITMSFRPLTGSDFNLLDEKAEKLDQVRTLLESRFITTNITNDGQPLTFSELWNVVLPEDLTFVGEKMTVHLKSLRAVAEEKKTEELKTSTDTSAA